MSYTGYWYRRELYAIASPYYGRASGAWQNSPKVCKMIIYSAIDRHGGIVYKFRGRVWPAHLTNDLEIDEVSHTQEVLKKDTFGTQAEAEKALFMRKLKGEVK